MDFEFSWPYPNTHLLHIEINVSGAADDTLVFQLPVWRPGRYELGHFERNIKYLHFFSPSGEPLPFEKVSRNEWRVHLNGLNDFRIEYEYYAARMDAGSTYVSDAFTLINFVNCCLFPRSQAARYRIRLSDAHSHLRIASPLPMDGPAHFTAESADHLFDNFLIASETLQQHRFYHRGLEVFLWFQGPVHPPFYQMEEDFQRFMDEALAIFGSFPIKQYHFLFIFPTYRKYHGVEHQEGTVIVLGPPHQIFERRLGDRFYTYKQLLGISAHEFFHLWNVKAIRPEELYPIDYSQENYTRLGFFLEGVTSYYGEVLLLRSGLLTFQSWARYFSRILNGFFANYGRFNKSLAESSFDLWVDGYRRHVPHRTTSIYTHGALVAFLIDISLRKVSHGAASLDTLMRYLYEEYAQQNKGFPASALYDYLRRWGGDETAAILDRYVFGREDIEPALADALEVVGVRLEKTPRTDYAGKLGFQLSDTGVVTYIVPMGEAYQAGLAYDDRIVAVNGIEPRENDFAEWLNYCLPHHQAIELAVMREGRLLSLSIPVSPTPQMFTYEAVPLDEGGPLKSSWLRSLVPDMKADSLG